MSRIDDLLADLAPQGVPFASLGDLGEFVRGNGLKKADLLQDGVPAIHYGQIHTFYGIWAGESKSFTSPELAAKMRHARFGDLIIATTSEDDAAVAKATAWLGDTDVVVGGDAYIYRHNLESKYVAYFFASELFQRQKAPYISGAKVRRISGASLARIRIAVPPLEVQREIVRVLDQFSQLEAELEAKLEAERRARAQQFDYYRDQLIDAAGSRASRHVELGEVGSFIRGRRFTKADMVPDGLPSIHYGEIYTAFGVSASHVNSFVRPSLAPELRYAAPGDVIVTSVGETVDDVGKAVAWLGNTRVAIHDDSFAFRSGENPVFMSYLMQTAAYKRQKRAHVSSGKMKRISQEGFRRLAVSLPSVPQQVRIADQLDRFSALLNDPSRGLLAEREKRRTQYEYYRDKLLTFEEAPA